VRAGVEGGKEVRGSEVGTIYTTCARTSFSRFWKAGRSHDESPSESGRSHSLLGFTMRHDSGLDPVSARYREYKTF
jgi:hypothetical protein